MSIQEIEAAVAKLPPEQLRAFCTWLKAYLAKVGSENGDVLETIPFEQIEHLLGVFDGPGDLSTNPKYMKGFGGAFATVRPITLLDTGPLVAALDRKDQHHGWAVEQFRRLPLPFLTCEAVCTEAAYLLRQAGTKPADLLALVASGAVVIRFDMKASPSDHSGDHALIAARSPLRHLAHQRKPSHLPILD